MQIGIILLVVGVVILLVVACQRCSGSEYFGQDASIRAQSGWLAGPKGMYGYDPIDHFAKQIKEMKARERARLILMSDYPNLESSPTKDIGPEEYHYLDMSRKCNHHLDCREGEMCRGVCVPTTVELYEKGGKGETPCKSCMTTEDFEAEFS